MPGALPSGRCLDSLPLRSRSSRFSRRAWSPRSRPRAPAEVDAPLPDPALKPAPRLVPPRARESAAAPSPGNRRRRRRRRPRSRVPRADGAIFLRADRLESTGEQSIEASGKVELRTRRETVLADWLRYDFATDEIWGKGDVLIRYGIDWITGPELKYKRGTETGFFASPRFFVGENGGAWQRVGDPLRGSRPLRGERCALHDVRRAARGLVPQDGRARGRPDAHGRHRPRCHRLFLRGARHLFAVVRVPAVERAQVGLPHADDGHHRHAGLRILAALLPQSRAQLRCDDHAAAHVEARHADRRGGPLPVRERPGRDGRGIPAARPRHRDRPIRAFMAAYAEPRRLAARPHRLLEPQQGVRRHLLLGSVRPRRPHVADHAAARGRLRLHQRAVAGPGARAGLPDAAGPDASRSPSPTTACRRRS